MHHLLSGKPMQKFTLDGELTFFEKSDGGDGKTRRIAGVISTEIKDKQDETVLQKGLDFSYFLKHGFFNDNHSKKSGGILATPERVKFFAKGEKLPDGETATVNCTWAEGVMLDTPDARKTWDAARALKKATGPKRRMGFSLEGDVERRTGPNNKTIAKAVIRHVAITHAPVGEETRLETIEKAEKLYKALTMGGAPGDGVPDGPATGDGVGAVLSHESVEGHHKLAANQPKEEADEDDDEVAVGGMSKSIAALYVRHRLPFLDPAQAARVVDAVITREKNMSDTKKPSIDALNKALSDLEASVLGGPQSRTKELLAKANANTITGPEQQELSKALANGGALATEATKDFSTDPMIKSVDGSEYLSMHAKATIAGFKVIAEAIEKSTDSDTGFRKGIAAVFKAQNELIKSLVEQGDALQKSLDAFGGKAAAPAKSQGVANQGGKGVQPIQKGFAADDGTGTPNPTPGDTAMVKSLDGAEFPCPPMHLVKSTLTAMLTQHGMKTIAGRPIEKIVLRADAAGEVDPVIVGEVAKFLATKGSAA